MIKRLLKNIFKPVTKRYHHLLNKADKTEVDALYKVLYDAVHNEDQALNLAALQTKDTFGFQWAELKEGEAMLSDKWFKDNVTKIICEEESLIKPEWFKGKDVIDCGCGGGRWSYGLAKLGANVTAVDINESAIEGTKSVLENFNLEKNFILTSLEHLGEKLPKDKKYDLAWSWGVLHHCGSFTKAFSQVMNCVKEGGFIYLYLYGREGVPYHKDIALFKQRIIYNTLKTWKEKEAFLLEKSGGDRTKIHQKHDIFAPLLNRRFEFDYIKNILETNGFVNVTRTIDHSELHIRAEKAPAKKENSAMTIPFTKRPVWHSKYNN
ncbi:MAG: class I SAM-dependent methyltransferase [Cytophagaceae bacterium]|nr:class I SAM-dependent methyltransferase [Cytophagaceae bacterium]